ncbi:sodium:calcium antiporter [Saccharomonospora iraqiensis]|uniref:sodium:calcium antiporter n=1 Tax=Saccharomonospora iraqiensis TaxID=52698 RepID=UPI0004789C90|nr:sodium:calcium antiporter [Saccharomonospora iraqiensis]
MNAVWGLPVAIPVFVVSATVIGFAGVRLARVVDRLADRTGLGEAIAGMVLLAGATSLAGLVVSIVAALSGEPSLAVSNSAGGIAAQTAFIVVADLAYRRINLEHAAASLTNIFSSLLMVVMLSLVLLGATSPPVTVAGVHPATALLLLSYGYGLVLSRKVGQEPMWKPTRTTATRTDVPGSDDGTEPTRRLWGGFVVLTAAVLLAGFGIGRAGVSIAEQSALTGTTVGTFLTSVATSLPELVTTVAAVRAGALTLAVAGIVGGNTFDLLFIAGADVAYRQGSIYHAITSTDLFVLAWTMLLIGVIAAGLVRRQREGIGFEGFAVLGIYLGGLVIVSTG